jgi:hypothetical protein
VERILELQVEPDPTFCIGIIGDNILNTADRHTLTGQILAPVAMFTVRETGKGIVVDLK